MEKKENMKPTEKELEILTVLWERGAVSVREVYEVLGGAMENGYTTILKLLQIMHEKGLVTRQKQGKLHLYQATLSKEGARRQLMDRMLDKLFQGSVAQMVVSALGNKKSSKEELDEIRKYLDNLDKK